MTRREYPVSGFFAVENDVDRAIDALMASGVPRDLIDVVVSPRTAETMFTGRTVKLGSRALRFAAIGGLFGILFTTFASMVIVLLPGLDLPRPLSLIQLVGPNVGFVGGGLVGAAIGALLRRRPHGVHARAFERPETLVVVRARSKDEAARAADVLRDLGASALQP